MKPYQIILVIHVAFGFTALATGIIPMLAQKGSKTHKLWGNVYYWAMFGVFVTTVALFALRPTEIRLQFFLCIAILSFYLTFSGRRVLQMKQSALQATLSDKAAAIIALASGAFMLGYAIYTVAILHNYFLSPLFAFFGAGLTVNSYQDWRLFTGKQVSEKLHWYFGHISKIMGAYIATVTAFSVNMTRYLPDTAPTILFLIPWFVPSLVLGVATAYYSKRQRELKKMPVSYGALTGILRKLLVK